MRLVLRSGRASYVETFIRARQPPAPPLYPNPAFPYLYAPPGPRPSTMTELAEREELHATRREIRQLQDTIVALRAQMEELEADCARAIQEEAQVAAAEMRQLRETVQALRDQIEQNEERARQQRVDTELATRAERRHLEDTIRALREELEARDGAGAS